ncbi:soluble pyridine nucleotide transhydrogenase [Salmonella enterica subsp. enterica]|uniref:Soluble pyridine nucleotide transhydrogenase n=1 Tax=Salmonella enterica I TaxID=59201 RepID=A0A379X2N8_SALET|nr:soluble pyridine nucleotide transhydrogenase [Salmonella enterica subsp. enterica]
MYKKQVSNTMPHSWDYDAVVIGSGPGGEGAAMGLVKQGARVAVIERYHNVGGGCTHWGTIPIQSPSPRRQPHY